MNNKRFQIIKASVTAEAALVFPIFFFVLMVFLCFFQWMLIQAEVQKALFETASFASQYSFFAEEVLEDKNSSTEKKSYGYQGNLLEFSEGILDMALIKMKFDSILDDRISESICVAGNNIGISFLKSEFLQNGNDIDIVAEYKIRIPFPIFEGYSFRVTQCVKTKAFLGKTMQDETEYSGEDEQREKDDDSVVYITETGRVYHTSKKCNYLNQFKKMIFYLFTSFIKLSVVNDGQNVCISFISLIEK